jgi:hypothetical protein
VKQKLGLENFSGWLADSEAKREREGRENKYEYQVNVNHAIGVSKTG